YSPAFPPREEKSAPHQAANEQSLQMDSRRKTSECADNAASVLRAPRTAVWSQTFGGDELDIATAAASASDGFSQPSPGRRTLSWVSSAFSVSESLVAADVPVGGSKGQTAVHENEPVSDLPAAVDTDKAGEVDSCGASMTRRQHVRLTTIDPITGSIAHPSSMVSIDENYNS
ncbi:hypothetical protein GGH95_005307, partial [Coemansia sp. RSA 1836]